MVSVSWENAIAFCEWLSEKEGVTYRLPTEAEWEYTCRAGSQTSFYWGYDQKRVGEFGNVSDLAAKQTWSNWEVTEADDGQSVTADVGSYGPNAFGLYDMIGNVEEWCSDWYSPTYYRTSPVADPTGPSTGNTKVVRGGAWSTGPGVWGPAMRGEYPPGKHSDLNRCGFRLIAVFPVR